MTVWPEPGVTAVVVATFLGAGLAKGVVGLGFPTITVAVLAAPIGLAPAIAVTVVPAIVTNVAQALAGGRLRALLRRLWPLLACALPGGLVGTAVLAAGDAATLTRALGVLLAVYAAMGLVVPPLPHPGRWHGVLGAPIGFTAGLVAGMVGSFTLPAVAYLQALRLPRDELVQALGLVFLTLSLGLAAGLGRTAQLTPAWLALSLVAIVPSLVGMEVGRRLRRRLPERRFRTLLFVALFALGTHLALGAGG
ncbi:MAG: TSUP family transporter [Alphaproteobacteria bacterium]|nr:TSUP family transporter [Alphaproteobacteria bacterium]